MSHENFMGRREFMRTTTGAITAGLGVSAALEALGQQASSLSVEEAVQKVGRLPRRKLGRSKLEVSVLVGAVDWPPEVTQAGILCGINYWHKAHGWEKDSGGPRTTPAAILKNRDAFHCEVCVDRVRGNHETGQIDEEAHYQFVKQVAARSGLGYFDDMKFHFGYHNIAELKNNRGPIRVFERLKKEGLARHLSLSQHSYTGNPKVPGGEGAPGGALHSPFPACS